ncbi:MAG: hypothetical protein K2X81_22910 [Candidatus Obscuribacterales bacterium]|nr:hypothetical protein [Candidatus Obscuribacterales bacterium]
MPDFTVTSSIYSAHGFMPPDSEEVHAKRLEQYLSLFPIRTGSTYKRPESQSWRAMSQYHSLSDEEIEDSLDNKPAFIRACPMGTRSRFAVLGIPAESMYSNPERIAVITELLRNIGLSPVLYGSASCDEIQIYLFFDKEMKTKLITEALRSLLTRCGLKLDNNLVVYDEDRVLVFPLQQGFSWLNDSLQIKVCRDQISFESALAMFCADMDKFRSSLDALLEIHSRSLPVVEFEDVDQIEQIEDGRLIESSDVEVVAAEQVDFSPPSEVILLIEESIAKAEAEVVIKADVESESNSAIEPEPEQNSESMRIETIGFIDHVLTDEEVQNTRDEQIDFTPEQAEVIDVSVKENSKASTTSKKTPKGLPYISEFIQLVLPIPGAQASEPVVGTRVSVRKSRRSKRGPPET